MGTNKLLFHSRHACLFFAPSHNTFNKRIYSGQYQENLRYVKTYVKISVPLDLFTLLSPILFIHSILQDILSTSKAFQVAYDQQIL